MLSKTVLYLAQKQRFVFGTEHASCAMLALCFSGWTERTCSDVSRFGMMRTCSAGQTVCVWLDGSWGPLSALLLYRAWSVRGEFELLSTVWDQSELRFWTILHTRMQRVWQFIRRCQRQTNSFHIWITMNIDLQIQAFTTAR